MAIRAWLKVPCNKAGGSRAPGRDSAFPHLLCKAGKPPEAGKIHRAETRQQSLRIRAQISCGWRDYPSLCPACGAPEAALHHHPHGIHHTTSPPASQPWPAAVGIPKISLCSVGLLSHPSTPAWLFSLPSTAELPTCPVLTGIPGAALCPQAAACPQQSLLFANHTQDTRGMPAMFASSYRY